VCFDVSLHPLHGFSVFTRGFDLFTRRLGLFTRDFDLGLFTRRFDLFTHRSALFAHGVTSLCARRIPGTAPAVLDFS